MQKVKYAIIGFGGIAENRIAKEGFACDKSRFAPLKHAELIAATDLNPARQSAAEALGLKWYGTIDELLADKSIDAVFVATNNASHVAIALQALAAGKHVIVEKPLATNTADAEKLIAAAKAANKSLTVDHMMIYNHLNRKAKELVKAGELGVVNDCCFHMEFAFGYDKAEAATWRCSKREEMGGPIGDVASHCFYVAEYIFDSKIKSLAAVYLPKLMETAVEDGAYIKFELASGLKGSAKVAFSELRGGLGGTLSNLGFELYGDKAVLRSYGTMFQLSGHPGEPLKIRMELDRFNEQEIFAASNSSEGNIYQALIENHAESVINGINLTGEDGLHNLKLCAAAHESASNNGKVVEIC